jgi:hypothetical protein
MSLVENDCRICDSPLFRGGSYWKFSDKVCLLCYAWANRIIYKLGGNSGGFLDKDHDV